MAVVRVVSTTATGLILIIAALELWAVIGGHRARGDFGGDLRFYQALARRWLDTGVLYAPGQLTGPYPNVPWGPTGPINLYPPPTILFFVAFLWLPDPLWWIIPYGIIGAGIAYWRPAWWSWPLLALALLPLQFPVGFAVGNSTIWFVAALMLATRWPATSVLLALKPSVLPFALLFARSRWWWIAAAAMGVVFLAFLPHWGDWWTAARNFEGGTLLYSLAALPLLLFPFVVRVAATRGIRLDVRPIADPVEVCLSPDPGRIAADPQAEHGRRPERRILR